MKSDRLIGLAVVLAGLLPGLGCVSTRKAVAPASFLAAAPADRGGELRRYIAVRHRLVLQTAAAGLTKAVETVIQLCDKLRCEVVSSSITDDSGQLSLRVAPEDLKAVFDSFGKVGRVASHTTESEDKTGTVIDVEARLKNLTAFRDNLRLMLAKPAATVKDLVEIQRELTNVQSELDGLLTRRKVLANETEKVAVEIAFRSRASTGAFAPLAAAWEELASVFFESLATLLTAVVAVAPWLVLIVPGVWLLRKLGRRWFRRTRAGFTAPN